MDDGEMVLRRRNIVLSAVRTSKQGFAINTDRLMQLIVKNGSSVAKIERACDKSNGWLTKIIQNGNAASTSIVLLANYFKVKDSDLYIPDTQNVEYQPSNERQTDADISKALQSILNELVKINTNLTNLIDSLK